MDEEKQSDENDKPRYGFTPRQPDPEISKNLVDTRFLIEAVHRRKCLWDRTDVDYRDRLAKDRAWKEIYREMEPDFDTLKPATKHQFGKQITKKWYNIRDSYVKSRRNSRTSRPYVYTEALSFLEPIIFENSNTRHENFIEDKMSNDDEAENSQNWINEVFIDVDEDMREAKRPRLDYATKVKEEIDDSEVNVVNVLANLIQREEDDDRAFFKSITPSVKKLSDEAKLEFRIQVLKLLKVLRVKDKKGMWKKEKAISDSD